MINDNNDVARAILAPALLRATSNIFVRLFSDVKLAQNVGNCTKTCQNFINRGMALGRVPLTEYAQLKQTLASCNLNFISRWRMTNIWVCFL